MRKFLGVCLFVLLLTGSTSAGIMPNGVPAPPPPDAAVLEPDTVATTEDGIQSTFQYGVKQAALDLLALLPSLL